MSNLERVILYAIAGWVIIHTITGIIFDTKVNLLKKTVTNHVMAEWTKEELEASDTFNDVYLTE